MILCPEMKSKVIEVERIGDRVMRLKLLLAGKVLNIVSAYAPQVGRSTEEKEDFYEIYEEVILACHSDESLIVGADMNGHVGRLAQGYQQNHGGKGFGTRNE